MNSDTTMMTVENDSAVVLIADDDDLVLKTLNVLITSLGHRCLLATDGLEALEILSVNQCDLIITDILMPNMGGLELLDYVREQYPQIDIIIAAGYGERTTYAEVIKKGAIDFIKKPLDQEELEAKLNRALRERRMISELGQLTLNDTLVPVLNKRAFEQHLQNEVGRAYRQNYHVFLAILNIDNLKKYNKKYGEGAGDKILVVLGNILNEWTRNSVDTTFRLGGDEFAVLLPQTTGTQATEIVQRILLKFVEANYTKITVSIGLVSCHRDPDLSFEADLARMKDHALKTMKEAKDSGKNCVICRL